MNRTISIVLSVLVLLAVLPSLYAFKSTVTLQGGLGIPQTDITEESTYHPMLGISWEAWLKDYLSLGIDPYYTKLEAVDGANNFESTVMGADLFMKLRATKYLALNFEDAWIHRISPYLDFGIGVLNYDEKGQVRENNVTSPTAYEKTVLTAPRLGVGLSFQTKWGVNLDLGAKIRYTADDYLDGYKAPDYQDGYYTPYLGLGFNFGFRKDRDKDGIVDSKDKAPNDPEDFDRFEDEDGAPEPDNDMDGVLDINDGAPNDPEDIDGFQDEDGVPDPDNDKDGILDVNDKAPNDPEDKDGFQDEDGVPDPDNDKDGILDVNDKAPNDPEDKDGFQDEDGVPDPDNDKDGILDVNDKAPNDPEDKDGFQDEDGVPDPDNDKDGILDVNDKAPNDPEDKDGFQDEDGVPDPDNDKDGILDVNDKAPGTDETARMGIETRETMNGFEDEDGVPDVKPVVEQPKPVEPPKPVETPKPVERPKPVEDPTPEVTVTVEPDFVLNMVHFETDGSELSAADKALLDPVVTSLKQHPEIKVEVQGHTDSRGAVSYNETLSMKRAEAVVAYLVGKGIDASRLTAKGYGPSAPIDDNSTKAGRANNRRVEFKIIK